MKRQLLILSTLILSIMTCQLEAIAQQFTSGGIVYEVTGPSEVQATEYDNTTPDIVIPATVSYESGTYTVKQVNVNFQGSKALRSITIAPSTGLFNGSFQGCENLETVSIPMTKIADMQFYDCPKLDIWSAIHTESGNMPIGNGAFGLSEPKIFNSIDLTVLGYFAETAFYNRQYINIVATDWVQLNSMDLSNTESLTWMAENASIHSMPALKHLIYKGDYLLVDTYECPILESISLGESVKSLGFYGNTQCSPDIDMQAAKSLQLLSISGHNAISFDIPTTIIDLSLSDMPMLESISGTDNVKDIAISNCPKIKQLSLPSIESLSSESFLNNVSLTEIYLGKSLNSVNGDVFKTCPNIENIVYGGTLEEWNNIAFDDKYPGILSYTQNFWYGHGNAKLTQLNELTDLGQATAVNDRAFWGYKKLTLIDLPATVKAIGVNAFSRCTGLKKVILQVESIKSCSFIGCTALEDITLSDNLKYLDVAFNSHNAPDQVLTVHYGGELEQWRKVKRIPDPDDPSAGLMRLANGGFYFNGKLIDIIDYDDPEHIDSELAGSSSVKHIVIHCNSRYPHIHNGAFGHTYNLSTITLGASPKSRATGGFIVGEEAFINCYNLTDIGILDKLERVDADAFYDTGWYRNQAGGPVYLNTLTQGKCAYTYSGVAPEGTVVEFEAGTETILPSKYSHSEHEGICGIILPEGLRTIGEGAFSSNIKGDLTLPSSVETVGSQFASFHLDKFRIEDSKSPLNISLNSVRAKDIYIGRDIATTEGMGLFYMPEEEGTVTNFTYGPNVTRVGKQTALTSGETANLSDMHCLATVPPTCDSEEDYNWETEQNETVYPAFKGIDTEKCTLHVPAESVDAYKAAPGWSLFRNIVGTTTTGIDSIYNANDSETDGGIHYDYLGRRISPNASGLHIIRKGNAPAKKIIKR